MQEIFAQFPTPPTQQPAILEGQIFLVGYNHLQPIAEPLEEYEVVVPPAVTSRLQPKILQELSVFHHATADILLRKLHLSPNSYRHLQKQLAALSAEKPEDRYVEIIVPPRREESRFGSAPYVYTLGRRGYAYLRDKGVSVGRYRASDAKVHKEFPLRHRLAVNEFLLKAFLLVDEHPYTLRLVNHLHEQYWNGNPLKIHKPGAEKPKGLSPDLLVVFESFTPFNQYWLPVEINLSREWEKDWVAKVELYRYCIPAYKERLGTDILTTIPVMVASPTSFPRMLRNNFSEEERKERQREAAERQRRMELLKKWTEETLDRLKMRREADLFSFSCAPLDELSPTELFFGKHWYIPFSDTPRPLLQFRKAGVP
jgi:hypothetical protein